jgi:hypothetical protein
MLIPLEMAEAQPGREEVQTVIAQIAANVGEGDSHLTLRLASIPYSSVMQLTWLANTVKEIAESATADLMDARSPRLRVLPEAIAGGQEGSLIYSLGWCQSDSSKWFTERQVVHQSGSPEPLSIQR